MAALARLLVVKPKPPAPLPLSTGGEGRKRARNSTCCKRSFARRRRVLFRQFQENLFQVAVQIGPVAQLVQRAAADQLALVDDADPVRKFLRDVERMRGQK